MFKPGMLIRAHRDAYDYMIWKGQELGIDNPVNSYGRIWIEAGAVGIIIKTGLSCHAVLFGETIVIVPINWINWIRSCEDRSYNGF